MTESERRAAVSSLIADFGMWAIGDDYDLGRAVEAAKPEALGALVAAVDALPVPVWEWLAGPEAHAPDPTNEYIAASEITLAADLARVTLRKLGSQ
jgi:hypothetical protein